MSRPRIVLDTNVLISAALKPQGQQALVVYLVALGAVELFVSSEVLAEYREVFSRPKFADLDQAAVSRLLSQVESAATMVTTTARLSISKHEPDNRFYECAEEAAADYIVTGNLKHFSQPHKSTKIITGAQFLALIGNA
jgi:putative PIN family toxin of toxin-antitoxin system